MDNARTPVSKHSSYKLKWTYQNKKSILSIKKKPDYQ